MLKNSSSHSHRAVLWQWVGGIVLLCASAAWLWPHVTRPGMSPPDEGYFTLLAEKLLAGQRPWHDFYMFSTSAMGSVSALALWFKCWGVSLFAGRLLVFVHVLLSSWLLWWIGLRMCPLVIALIGVALFVVFGSVTAWPDPYSTWFALPWYLLGLWALLRWRSTGAPVWPVIVGATGVVTLFFRPGAGLASVIAPCMTLSGWYLFVTPAARAKLLWRRATAIGVATWCVLIIVCGLGLWQAGLLSSVLQSLTTTSADYMHAPAWNWQRPWLLVAIPWLVFRAWPLPAIVVLLVMLGLGGGWCWLRGSPGACRVTSVMMVCCILLWSQFWPWSPFLRLFGASLLGFLAVVCLATMLQVRDRIHKIHNERVDDHLAVTIWAGCWLLVVVPHWNEAQHYVFVWPLGGVLIADLLYRWSRWLSTHHDIRLRRYTNTLLVIAWGLPCMLFVLHAWTQTTIARRQASTQPVVTIPKSGIRIGSGGADYLLATVRDVQARSQPNEPVLVIPFQYLISLLADRPPVGYDYLFIPKIVQMPPEALISTIQSLLHTPVRLAVMHLSGFSSIDSQMPELFPLVDFLERRTTHAIAHGPWRILELAPPRVPRSQEDQIMAGQQARLAREALEAGRLLSAAELAQHATDLDDTLAEAHVLLGQIRSLQMQQAGRLPPITSTEPWPVAKRAAGLFLLHFGQEDRGWPYLLQAQQAAPYNAEMISNVGQYDLAAGRWEEAVAAFTKLTRLRPHEAGSFRQLGEALLYGGQYGQAIEAFQHVLTLWPDATEVAKLLAYARQMASQSPSDP